MLDSRLKTLGTWAFLPFFILLSFDSGDFPFPVLDRKMPWDNCALFMATAQRDRATAVDSQSGEGEK